MTIHYLYPEQDKEVGQFYDWLGTYADIDEGATSPNDSDYIQVTDNGFFIGATRDLVSFYFTDMAVIPSSITVNIRGELQWSPGTTQKLSVASLFLKDYTNNIIGQYVETGVLPAYAWNVNAGFSTFNINLSGVQYYNNYQSPYLEILLSGIFGGSWTSSNAKISALDIKMSGDTDIQASYDVITLYISGQVPTGINDNITLYTVGHMISDSGLSLYTEGNAVVDSGLSLHTWGWDTNTSGISLYTAGHIPVDSGLSLYTTSHITNSGILPLFVKGYGDTGINTMPLYLQSLLSGVDYGWSNNTASLFVKSIPESSGELNLYIEGQGTGLLTNTVTLHTFNSEDNSNLNSIPLYMVGGLESGGLPLYLCNNTQLFSSANSGTLYVAGFDGTTISGLLNNTTSLYIGGNPTNNSVNLVIINSGIDSLTNNLNIAMVGRDIVYDSVNSGTSLTVWNQYTNVNSGVDLFLYARQAYDMSGSLNLFMSREVESVAGNVSLYMSAPLGVDSGISMYMSGNTTSFNSVTLVIPSSIGFPYASLTNYLHGF